MTNDELLAKLKELFETDDTQFLFSKVYYNKTIADEANRLWTVFVKIDKNSYVTDVDSDAFITDFTSWIRVDEGYGELYKFARNNYCKYGLTTYDDNYNYKLVRGKVVYMPMEPVAPTPTVEERLSDLETAICDIMDMLAET